MSLDSGENLFGSHLGEEKVSMVFLFLGFGLRNNLVKERNWSFIVGWEFLCGVIFDETPGLCIVVLKLSLGIRFDHF